ncbi:GntR family transcriptional regulator [Pseudonocardia autotrophica]|uniref:HTH-type transcriptional regulator LutR n=2 Tax=Pseudonocardia TaxID=1847 RepID=A0A1Y2N026_PSEAH|nr:FCD domain-containing protein [Pseudonocardia autotrophica]OSY40804.1 HTH-type transcriptional regulator LutR [Pseudonocardia autotrophica]TDN71888.1 GntR family transcriptional regulator [Pseudonocardia autotrophica]
MAGPAARAMKQSEIVARQIVAQILGDRLAEGTRLPTERAMLETYQVGRSTLREALRMLESRGILSIRTGRDGGPVVRRPRASDLGEAMTLILQFEGIEFAEVFAARQALEPILAGLAAEHAEHSELEELRGCVDRMASSLDESAVFHAENLRFHELVARAAGSPVLELISHAVEWVADGIAFGAVDAGFSQGARQVALTWHERIHAAIAAGDAVAATAAMEGHLEDSREAWMSRYSDLTQRLVEWTPLTEAPA